MYFQQIQFIFFIYLEPFFFFRIYLKNMRAHCAASCMQPVVGCNRCYMDTCIYRYYWLIKIILGSVEIIKYYFKKPDVH